MTMAGFLDLDELFEGRHFNREIIVLPVRWYVAIRCGPPATMVTRIGRGPGDAFRGGF